MPQCADARAVGEFAASRYGTFDLCQAASNGLTRNHLARMERDGLIDRIRPSVWRFTAVDVTWRHETYAATLGRRATASHFSAAALHGLDGLCMPPVRAEILTPHGAPLRLPGVVTRRSRWLPRADVTIVDGIPCTTIARTICDVAAFVDHDALVRAIDDVQRRGCSLQWMIERATLLQRCGRAGPTQVLDIVRRRVDGYRVPDSWFERLLEACLRSPLLQGMVRQHELITESGDFVARFDLALPWAKLGIEGHSRSFHLGESVERYDEDRDLRSAQEGWEIAYLGFAATRSPLAVCRDIEAITKRRMLDLGVRPPAP